MLFAHALATLYSPVYLSENIDGLRQGWPRIPLPKDPALLLASARLGCRLKELLDPDQPVEGVTSGEIAEEIASVAVPLTIKRAARDWSVSNWGNRTDAGVTMPLRGRVKRAEAVSGADESEAPSVDVFMNDVSYWSGIPEHVWHLRIGGYQVLKKWLSYRDSSITKRPLTRDEVKHFQDSARRMTALVLMGPELSSLHKAVAVSAAMADSGLNIGIEAEATTLPT